MPGMTAKELTRPLLKALGALSQFSTDPVRSKDVEDRLLEDLGIKEDAFGFQSSTGKPLTRLRAQHAMTRQLIPKGLATKGKRGWWSLSEDGVNMVRAMAPQADLPTLSPQSNLDLPTEVANGGVYLSFEICRDSKPPLYEDEYLQSVAVASTPCFGKRSPTSKVCKTCPIEVECSRSQASLVSQLAETLRKRDQKANPQDVESGSGSSSTQVQEDSDLLDILKALEDESGTTIEPEPETDVVFKAPVESVCYKCNKTVKAGQDCIWVANMGIKHPGC